MKLRPRSWPIVHIQRYTEEEIKTRAYSIWERKGRPPNQTKEQQDADYAEARRQLHQEENPVISAPTKAGTSQHPELRRGQAADPAALAELQQKLGSVLGPVFIESMKTDAEEDIKTRAYAIWEAKGRPPDQSKEQQEADYEAGRRQLDEEVKRRAYSIWEEKRRQPNPPPTQTKQQQDADYYEARQKIRAEAGFGPATEAAIKEFQKRNGQAETGVADAATWKLLDATGKSSVGRVERQWDQQMSYGVTGMTSKFSWAIEDRRVVIKVGINFISHPTRPPTDLAGKATRIKEMVLGTWNRFKAVRTDGKSDTREIVFEIPTSGGNIVNVVDGDGQSDAENWFWGDVLTYPNVPAHEFGHMIGLEDEYQRPEPDYKRLFPGQDVTAAKGAGGYGPDEYTDVTSLMGLGSIDTHPDRVNPPEPRHVREFVKYIEDYLGGTWKAEPK